MDIENGILLKLEVHTLWEPKMSLLQYRRYEIPLVIIVMMSLLQSDTHIQTLYIVLINYFGGTLGSSPQVRKKTESG